MLNVSFVLLYSKSCLLDLYYESKEDDGVYGRLDSFTSSLMYLTFIHGSLCVYNNDTYAYANLFFFLLVILLTVFCSFVCIFRDSIRQNEPMVRITKQDEIPGGWEDIAEEKK